MEDKKTEQRAQIEKMIDEVLEEKRREEERMRLEKTVNRKTNFEKDEIDFSYSLSDNLIYKKSKRPEIIELQKRSDEIYLLSQILKKHPTELSLWKDFVGDKQSELAKAMGSSVSERGAEWIPTGFSADLIDRIRLATRVASIHTRIDMPTNPYKSPVVGSDTTAYLIAEATVEPETATRIKASNLGTRQVIFTAVKLGARVAFSEELNEDSIIPILPSLRENIIRALANAQETATINGDTTTPHLDNDVTAPEDARKAWKGYRKLALPSAKVDFAGSVTLEKLRTVRKALGKYGVLPSNLCWIVGISGLSQILALNTATTTRDVVLTPDRYPPNIPDYIEGEQCRIDNVPVIVSEFVREDLNPSGVYDGTTKTKTILILVNRLAFQYGDRRIVTVKTQEDIQTDQTILVATQRLDFQAIPNPATETIVGIGYNIPS